MKIQNNRQTDKYFGDHSSRGSWEYAYARESTKKILYCQEKVIDRVANIKINAYTCNYEGSLTYLQTIYLQMSLF